MQTYFQHSENSCKVNIFIKEIVAYPEKIPKLFYDILHMVWLNILHIMKKKSMKILHFVLPVFLLYMLNIFVLEVAMDIILHSVTT